MRSGLFPLLAGLIALAGCGFFEGPPHCRRDADCTNGLICLSSICTTPSYCDTGCNPPGSDNIGCWTGLPCASGYQCVLERCLPKACDGVMAGPAQCSQGCDADSACGPGAICAGGGGCFAAGGSGQLCYRDGGCNSGSCGADGTCP